jgi:hypothetical protein
MFYTNTRSPVKGLLPYRVRIVGSHKAAHGAGHGDNNVAHGRGWSANFIDLGQKDGSGGVAYRLTTESNPSVATTEGADVDVGRPSLTIGVHGFLPA